MKKCIKRIVALIFFVVMVFQLSVVDVSAIQITGNVTVYIKAESGDSYLYADGNDVKCGALKKNDPKYLWEFTKKSDGTYWIKNAGTNTYMCLEYADGTVKLESTIYEVWESSKWIVNGNSTSSTIYNLWKGSATGADGYIYTKAGSSTVYYGTTGQRWVFEEYGTSSGSGGSSVTDDGNKGSLNGKIAADAITIPAASTNLSSVGATMPYVRYDSEEATLGGGARLMKSTDWALNNIASQASNQSYVELPSKGAYAQWKMTTSGNGVVMRFTLPDTSNGMGMDGSLDIYVNGSKVKTVDLTSYYMWQYLNGGANDTPGNGTACFAFDEVHFRLDKSLKAGDTIRVQSTGAGNVAYGVDFLEIEETGKPIAQPEGSYSVVDFGAIPDDGIDDYAAITACISAADAKGKDVYFPQGTYHINQIWRLSASDMMLTGAGIWYTNIQFTNPNRQSGGISGAGNGTTRNIEFCNMYINSNLRSRYGEDAVYKGFMDVFDGKSLIHDVWVEHFECGFWIGDYNGTLDYSDGIKIVNCRVRNNFADGVNFCQGTSNATVYNCNIRNNGDDGLAMWNNNFMSAKDETNNVFCYNTIELGWRAGAIAIYGGNGHKIYNNYIRDMFMSSGIHLNTNFGGYKFNNTKNIQFDNNIIITSGCSWDSWKSEFGAIDIIGDTKNITFNNTYIYNAQHDGIRVGDNISNIVFNDLYIYGTGVDGQTPNYSSLAHKGAAIMSFNGSQFITVNRLKLSGIAYSGTYYRNSATFNINGETKASSYTVPGYPKVGSIDTNHDEKVITPDNTDENKETTTQKPTATQNATSSQKPTSQQTTTGSGSDDLESTATEQASDVGAETTGGETITAATGDMDSGNIGAADDESVTTGGTDMDASVDSTVSDEAEEKNSSTKVSKKDEASNGWIYFVIVIIIFAVAIAGAFYYNYYREKKIINEKSK